MIQITPQLSNTPAPVPFPIAMWLNVYRRGHTLSYLLGKSVRAGRFGVTKLAVYVDEARAYGHAPLIRGKQRRWAHLMADTVDELHDFATRKLGLRYEWYQGPPKHAPHYDVVETKRELALQRGALPMTREKFMELMEAYRGQS